MSSLGRVPPGVAGLGLPIELLGVLGWLGVVVSMVWEGTHPLYKGEFDRIAIALTVMSGFES